MKVTVTTSWDDGHVQDERLAKTLARHNVHGTFYIAPYNREIPEHERLSDARVLELSKQFEIGAHTMTHPHLTKVPLDAARDEILGSKKHLERVTGKEVKSFCYPAGYYNDDIREIVKDAGFTAARTVQQGSRRIQDPLLMPTTVHAYNHWWHFGMPWDELAILSFDATLREGGVFHLWGHSWEINLFAHWEKLERVLAHIGNREGVTYATNSQLV